MQPWKSLRKEASVGTGKRLAKMEEAVERRVEERVEQEVDAMLSHLEQELDDPKLLEKVLRILASGDEEGK